MGGETPTTLSPELVLSKTGATSLENVTKLNICGYSINNVDILQRLPNVETLSLSVNQIRSLQAFSSCSRLTEVGDRDRDRDRDRDH